MLRIKSFFYNEPGWKTGEKIEFQQSNLIVGRNSVGKSQLLKKVILTVRHILQLQEPNKNTSFLVGVEFVSAENLPYFYQFAYIEGEVQQELFYKGSNVENPIIYRDGSGNCLLNGTKVTPPASKLVVNVRRDIVQFPDIEMLFEWAENTIALFFNELDFYGDDRNDSSVGLRTNLYDMVKALDAESIEHVLEECMQIGYPLKKIEATEIGTFKKVLFYEDSVNQVLFDHLLSKGMFRVVYVLIMLEYLSKQTYSGTLIIDDFCEGLDYSRSTKLGKLLFRYCEEKNIQLIVTSNDCFLMDVVDMTKWNVLTRKGGTLETLNYENSKSMFDEFAFTGMSNFDFFSSDFIERYKASHSDHE